MARRAVDNDENVQIGAFMRLSFATFGVELQVCQSRTDLDNVMQAFEGHRELIDTTRGQANSFYLLSLRPQIGISTTAARCVGICAARTGLEPQALISQRHELLYVGLNSSVLIVDKTAPTKVVDLDGCFYSMTLFSRADRILVIHEIGLLWLTPNGEIDWRYDTDIIASVALATPHTLDVRLLEGHQTTVDLSNGKILNGTVRNSR